MRTLSSPLAAALAAPVQRPTFLVQMDFSPVERWTSGPAITWGGFNWASTALRVEGLTVEALRVSGTLILDNGDDIAGTLVLGGGVNDRPITIYGYDAAATGAADVVWLASAVGASAQVDPREVRIELRHRSEYTACPRIVVDLAAGFTHLLPGGTTLRINDIAYRLERRN